MQTAKEVQNETATYGLAAGFAGAKPRSAGRANIKDRADRDHWIANGLADYKSAEQQGNVMHRQTLGGQITRHEGPALEEEERGKPVYFLGAFRDQELHLTKVDGTVQMRPQFHHLDAEEQRTRLAASRAAAMDPGAEQRSQGDPRSLLMKNKTAEESEKDKAEDKLRRTLQASEAEPWTNLEYVDEDQEEAYEKFRDRFFLREVDAAPKLKSGMENEEYLDAISMPRRDSPTRRRKRKPRAKREEVELSSGGEDELAPGATGEAQPGVGTEAGGDVEDQGGS